MAWITLLKDSVPWRYNIRKPSLNLLLTHFGIEMAYNYGHTAAGGCAAFGDDLEQKYSIQSYSVFITDIFALAWSYNSNTGCTQALCWGDSWIISTMQAALGYQKELIGHPMALGYLASIILGHLLDRDLLRHQKTIAEVEKRTGYHGWKASVAGVAQGDYGTLSSGMSGCATSLAGLQRIIKMIQETLGFMSKFSAYIPTKGPRSEERGVALVSRSIRECDELIQRRLVMQDTQLGFLIGRTQIQLTALFNLIGQKDAKLNIALAKDSRTLASASKRDSSSMKTLAAVTVAFLPATFVASFFAMPLFDWDAGSDSSVINYRFWIYWAVTAPLTASTLVIWLTWTHRQTLIHRAQDRHDRDRLVDEILGNEKIK